MDSTELTNEIMNAMQTLMRGRTQKNMDVFLKGEEYVLQYLAFNNNYSLPGEISQAVGVSTARIAATLNSLEGKGLILRQIDISDRRRILVEITEEGKALAQQKKQEMFKRTEQTLTALGETDSKHLLRIMNKLNDIMLDTQQSEP